MEFFSSGHQPPEYPRAKTSHSRRLSNAIAMGELDDDFLVYTDIGGNEDDERKRMGALAGVTNNLNNKRMIIIITNKF